MDTTTRFANPTTTNAPGHARPRTQITCSRCKATDTVPFRPTPGRRILCGACHKKARDRMVRAPRIPLPPPKRMLSMRRKGHFIYDAMEVVHAEGELEESQRRAFVEMVFARGSRQTSRAAIAFIEEKAEEGILVPDEAERLAALVQDYSRKR